MMGLLDDFKKAVPEDLKDKAREAAANAKAAAVSAGEVAQTAADAASDAFDKGEASFKQARAEGQGLTDAAKQAGRGALEPAASDPPAAAVDDPATPAP
jgi:hypothetical protein